MNIAFLFNSDFPEFGGWYGGSVLNLLLKTKVLQSVNRHMRVSVGDILTYGAAARSETPTLGFLRKLCFAVYQPVMLDRLIQDRLVPTHGRETVYCWLFQNMTAALADKLHAALSPHPGYLGAMDVSFGDPIHLQFFRNSLIEKYRLRGKSCSVFYAMGENEDPDLAVQEYFEENGFDVFYEDSGGRHTIFDDYDTPQHFKRVEDFKRVFAAIEGLDDDVASELVLVLEELHPKVFDGFAAAARTIERAETDEDLAQAALSGRRLLEQIADHLFPPIEKEYKRRKVGKAQYRNRLWAYIDKLMEDMGLSDAVLLERLGKEADRLVELFNSGLHASPTHEKVSNAFRDLVLWLIEIVNLSPSQARRPYLAYADSLHKFFLEAHKPSNLDK